MKIVLQHPQTGQFFRKLDEWTESIEEACDFEALSHAVQLSRTGRLEGARVMVHFDPSSLVIPLSPAAAEHLCQFCTEDLRQSLFLREAARNASDSGFVGSPLSPA